MEKNVRILMVDDNPRLGAMFTTVLAEEGVDVDFVETGEEAIKKVMQEKYDMCFLDVIMPGMNGLQVFEKIRESKNDLPVIIMSGYSISDLLADVRKKGVFKVILKPIDITHIMEVIREVMESK